jgi:hypothetical protein
MTYYFFLVLALAVAGSGYLVRRRSFFWGQVMLIAGCLGCAGCLAWQIRQNLFSPSAKGPDRGQAVVGYFLANQVLGAAGNQQGPVVLFFPPESVLDAETVGTYAGTFSRVLRGFPGLKVQVLTLAVPSKAAKAGLIPLAAFQRASSNAPPAVAYVSFAGVPPNIEDFLPTAGQRGPGFFVFDPWRTTNWLGALRKGRVRSVIVPRPGVYPAPDSEISGEPHEVFSRLYLMATPATADKIAAELGSK